MNNTITSSGKTGGFVTHSSQWISIMLDHEDMELCRERGAQRQQHAEERGFQAYGFGSAETHARGYMGELAMSRYLGVPMPLDWTWAADMRRGHDVGGWQVRTSAQPDGKLMIRPQDKDGHYTLILTHQRPVFYLVGWITLDRAKTVGFTGETRIGNRPVKYVSQHLLTPFPNIRGSFILKGDHYDQAA